MKVMLIGTSGQVGWELARSLQPLGEVVALDQAECDLSRPESVAGCVAAVAPDLIVNAAAYTAVDKAESEEALATRINGDAVGELACAARKQGALLIHYSTDYVFDGTKTGAYEEDDPVAPLNAYGRSKLAGEQAIQAAGGDYLILRTTWVYAARGSNFVRTMLRFGVERERLSVVADQIGAPTWARNIADATAQIAALAGVERRRSRFGSGIFHIAGGGETSWHGFAEAIFAGVRQTMPECQLKVTAVEPIDSAAYSTPAKRPLNSRLDQRRLANRFGIVMPPWHQSLQRCIEEMACR